MTPNLLRGRPKCQWGRTIFLDETAVPCKKRSIATVTLRSPQRRDLEGMVLTVCEEHLIQAVTIANPSGDDPRWGSQLVLIGAVILNPHTLKLVEVATEVTGAILAA